MLTMERPVDQVRITVKDEGKGFDATVAATAGPSPGEISSKFGLYSIQDRMRTLGGSLEIHSAPDQGTSASLVLPLTDPLADQRATIGDSPLIHPRSPTDPVPTNPSTIRVLLVDDHAMIRQGLRTMLEAYQDIHVIGEAANGEEAITLAHTLQPDVVLMDTNMPKLNGIEATAVIKRDLPHMAIVGLSVNADGATGIPCSKLVPQRCSQKKRRLKSCITPSTRQRVPASIEHRRSNESLSGSHVLMC